MSSISIRPTRPEDPSSIASATEDAFGRAPPPGTLVYSRAFEEL